MATPAMIHRKGTPNMGSGILSIWAEPKTETNLMTPVMKNIDATAEAQKMQTCLNAETIVRSRFVRVAIRNN